MSAQNNSNRIEEFVGNGFLKPLLDKPNITDISFNGEALFYEDRNRGRREAGIAVNNEQVGDFLRQIANLSEKQFSYLSPILDVSFGKYRLNATFSSITRYKQQKAYSFSIRVATVGSAISEDPDFFPGESQSIILDMIKRKESIAIAGETGSGKTELQKYLLMNLEEATRVIVIDNIGELELCRGDGLIDLTFWQADDRFASSSFASLIRNALRNNPDYLILAETRGEEMQSALQAVMSGHPIITTLHAKDITYIPYRMARMAQVNPGDAGYADVLRDVYHHFENLIYVSKRMEGGRIKRRVESIGKLKDDKLEIIYNHGEGE